MNIFDITDNILQLSAMIDQAQENGEAEDLKALVDTLEANEEGLAEKLNNIGWLMAQTNAEMKAYEEQEKRFKDKKEKAKNKEARLKELVTFVMNAQNKTKMKTEHFNYTFRKSVATKVIDIDKVPAEFIKTTVKEAPNLTEIKKYLKEHEGEAVEWATLEERKSLQIK